MDAQTPRTDKAAHGFCQSNPQKTAMDMWDIECVDADFARELERELATARNDALEEAANVCRDNYNQLQETRPKHYDQDDELWRDAVISELTVMEEEIRALKSK